METAGVEPAPPRCKRGVLPPDIPRLGRAAASAAARALQKPTMTRASSATSQAPNDPCYRGQHRFDVGVSRRSGGDNSVSAVAHDVTSTVASQPYGRCLSTLLQPLPVLLDLRSVQRLSATLADSHFDERDADRLREPLAVAHDSSFSLAAAVRTDGFEPPQREAARLQRAELTNAQRPLRLKGVTDRIRTGTSRLTTSGAAVTPRPPRCSGDDRARTDDLSPDKRALCAAELRPPRVARVGFEPTISSS